MFNTKLTLRNKITDILRFIQFFLISIITEMRASKFTIPRPSQHTHKSPYIMLAKTYRFAGRLCSGSSLASLSELKTNINRSAFTTTAMDTTITAAAASAHLARSRTND